MRKLIALALMAILASTVVPASAKKDDLPQAPGVLADADRTAAGGRLVQANLHQRQIEASVFVDPIARMYTGNIWGDMWIGSMDRDRRDMIAMRLQETAELNARPVRVALGDFDTDALVLATTRAALAKPDWVQAREIVVTTGPFAQSRVDFLAQNAAGQIVSIRYRYDLSHDLTQIRVLADVLIERLPMKDGKPTGVPVAIYRQHIMSIVQLRSPSYEARDNAKRWSADGGKLAKAALVGAFGQFEQLIPYALGLNQSQVTTFADKRSPKAFAGGYYGTLIARNAAAPDDVLIWYKGLVHVQPIG